MKGRTGTYYEVYQGSYACRQNHTGRVADGDGHGRNRSGGNRDRHMPSSSYGTKRQNREVLQADRKKLLLLAVISAMLLMTGICIFSGTSLAGSSVVEANQQLGEVQYKVIEIESGDSLWDIAEENMNPGFDSIFDYIREIKRCNQLQSDRITSGSYLMIPYYEVEVF